MRILLLAVLGCLASACATSHAVPRPYPGMTPPPSADAGGVPASPDAPANPAASPRPDTVGRPLGDAVVAIAEDLLGTPYRNGGADPDGFDCSGFVQYVFGQAGAALPRSVRELWQSGSAVDRGDLRPGDLVFFAIDGAGVSHVGIAIDGETFVHAPSSRGTVRTERLDAEYWATRYRGARRIARLRQGYGGSAVAR